MELDQVLSKVQKLIERGQHAGTPEHEARMCLEQADALMLKYAIDQATLRMTSAEATRVKPDTLVFSLGVSGSGDIDGYVASIASRLGEHCRVIVRNWSSWDRESRTYNSTAYGYNSDLRYFQLMWTGIMLHMTGILRPQVNPALSLEDNCYLLHEAGFNWLEIAEKYGWRKVSDLLMSQQDDILDACPGVKIPYIHRETREVAPSTKVGSHYKRAYYRAVAARGETPTIIAAKGSKTYRDSAAWGYYSRLTQRMREIEGKRTGSTALVQSGDSVLDFYREQNAASFYRCPKCAKLSASQYDCDRCGHHIADRPESAECPRCQPGKPCRAHKPRKIAETPFNQAAFRMGVQHANTADLDGASMATRQHGELS